MANTKPLSSGKKFEDSDRQLEISERFYKGELVSEEEAVDILKKGENMNLVGEEVISLALKEKIINEQDVIKIGGVKHAQIYSVA